MDNQLRQEIRLMTRARVDYQIVCIGDNLMECRDNATEGTPVTARRKKGGTWDVTASNGATRSVTDRATAVETIMQLIQAMSPDGRGRSVQRPPGLDLLP